MFHSRVLLNIEVCTIKVFDEQRTTRTNTNKIFELFFSAIFANICHIICEKSLIFLQKFKILFTKNCALSLLVLLKTLSGSYDTILYV